MATMAHDEDSETWKADEEERLGRALPIKAQ